MRTKRSELAPEERAMRSAMICDKLYANDKVQSAIKNKEVIAVYIASPKEIDLSKFIVSVLADGAMLGAPRWNGEGYELSPLNSLTDLVSGPMGILEPRPTEVISPAKPTVWVVPGLAFTPAGGRLGYGGGWYDRFLCAARNDALKLGVAYDFQLVDSLPTEEHDIMLDDVVVG